MADMPRSGAEACRRSRRAFILLAMSALALTAVPTPVFAANDRIGRLEYYWIRGEENLLEVARLHGVGYIELLAANPGIDPWQPESGRTLVLPKAHLLPDAPRRGIVINLAEMRLYFFREGGGPVLTFPVGIGRPGRETPTGVTRVIAKRENPTWTPPASIRAERPDLPAVVPPGPSNPLGLYALDLGWQGYVIHGTNKPYGVGRRISNGCIRLYPEDIELLFERVPVGTPVTIVDQPVKLGWSDGELYLEIHPTTAQGDELERRALFTPALVRGLEARVWGAAGEHTGRVVWSLVHDAARARRGIPVRITRADRG